MDLNKIGNEMASLLDMLAEEHSEGDAEVGLVLVVVELKDDDSSWISYRCSDPRPWVQRAMLSEALDLANAPPDEITEDNDDD